MSKDVNPSFLSSVQEAARSNVASPQFSAEVEDATLNNPLWYQSDIDHTRWNKLYPYRLSVVKAVKTENGTDYQENLKWQYTLPIPPESLDNSMNFAIDLAATLEGIHADHNGVVFQDINFSGTTGVLPLRGAAPSKDFSPLNSIFGGTLAAAGRTGASALSVVNGGVAPTPNFLITQEDIQAGDIGKSSGYAQFHVLSQFLRNYANFKKTVDGRAYRLVFSIYKDNESFLVEPVRFRLNRNASSALEYTYSLSLKAYGKIKLTGTAEAAEAYHPSVTDPNLVSQMLATVQAGRQTIYDATDVMSAIGMDMDLFLHEPIRKMALFLKEAAGSALSVAELPKTMVSGFRDAVVAYVGVAAYGNQLINMADKPSVFNQMVNDIKAIAEETGMVQSGLGSRVFGNNSSNRQPGLGNARSGASSADSYNADPAHRVFEDPIKAYSLFSAIHPADLALPASSIRAINEERQDVIRMTRKDFEVIRDNLEKFLTAFEFYIGGGHDTVATLYGTKLTHNDSLEPSDEHFEVIYALNRLIQVASKLAATRLTNQINISPVEYVAGLASRSGIAFTVPVSKFIVPFPYGHNLEDLARIYLGDPDRWMEISQLNGLRSPYVDEEGFQKPLLADGNENQLQVADSSNLALGQTVWVVSNTKAKTKRQIVGIEDFMTHSVITLNGDPDLEDYHYLAGAYLHAFLPGTVNSQMSIYIPSSTPVDDDTYQTKDIPGLEDFDPIIAAGGVDLLLTNDNDLVITTDGDARLAIGLSNIIQRIRVMLSVTKGTLNQHPEFGLPLAVGASLAEMSAKDIAESIKGMFNSIPSWSARDIQVNITGPTCKIGFNVYVPGTGQLLPVFFEIGIT